MHEAIREILNNIKPNMIFDSHFVIRQLLANHSDQYLSFTKNINGKTEIIHAHIGREIAKFVPELVTKMDNDGWSENIHGTPSKCAAWIKK